MVRRWLVVLALLAAGVLLVAGMAPAAVEAPRIAKEEVKARLGSADAAIIDVRSSGDWKKSDSKIQGAVREDPKKVKTWAKTYPKDKTLILYCA
ncbi:MAG: hypothetical protein ED859_14905 [Desulfuromonadales bacterium]|nr:MAG: hypothetical protein ED859_14905 [Desulfuromonadales bacterium]